MNAVYILSASKRSSEEARALGIILQPDARVEANHHGFLNSEVDKPVEWRHFREFETPHVRLDTDKKVERMAFDIADLHVTGVVEKLFPGDVISSKELGGLTVCDCLLTMHCDSLFDTATFQAHLWQKVYNDTRHNGLLGRYNNEFATRARARKFRVDDPIRFVCSSDSQVLGIAHLVEERSDHEWRARLYFANKNGMLESGELLRSFCDVRCDETVAHFESAFATIETLL